MYMAKNLLLVLFLLSSVYQFAEGQTNNRPKLGVALSGGGAKGLAHIGVIEAMEKGYAKYQRDLSASDCPRNEYQLSPEIVEYAISRPPYGLDKAISMLLEIYTDQSQPDSVRSHALYHVAVATMRRRDANYSLAESYLTQIGEEFPGTHACVIDYLLTEIRERKRFLQFDTPV